MLLNSRLCPLLLIMLLLAGCDRTPTADPDGAAAEIAKVPPGNDSQLDPLQSEVKRFCGGCHGVPAPETFPRSAWHDEVEQGFGFYYSAGRHDLDPPPKIKDVVEYYQRLAPVEWRLPPPVAPTTPDPLAFRSEVVPVSDPAGLPGVSHLRWWKRDDAAPVLLVCDMRLGRVAQVEFDSVTVRSNHLADVPHPAHVEPADLDRDGRPDLVVADLGSFEPADHRRGRVVWLRPSLDGRAWEFFVLADELGRVADVQPADLDDDGDQDIVVAEFGWRTTGRILLLEQAAEPDATIPQFVLRPLDDRHGTIHVPIIDLDGDGRLDFVSLISQEHEVIDVFLGRDGGAFERHNLFSAGDPSYGSSGIELVDLDRDGDLDVLYTNGDSLDSLYLKPFHSVQWLENTGSFPFTRHEIARMPGVYRARAADLDGDGDLDVVACAIFGYKGRESLAASGASGIDLYSLVWYEQDGPGNFHPHPLATMDRSGYMALEVGDFNGDGKIDIAAGQFASPSSPGDGWLTVWWNEGARVQSGGTP